MQVVEGNNKKAESFKGEAMAVDEAEEKLEDKPQGENKQKDEKKEAWNLVHDKRHEPRDPVLLKIKVG